MPYKIVICDDNKNVRAFLKMILTQRSNIDVIAEGSSGADAVFLCRKFSPDLLLIDVQMEEDSDGINAISKIREFSSEIKIIVLTVYSNDEFVINAFRNGADNFILKDLSAEEILKTVEDTLHGTSTLSQMVANKLKNFVKRDGDVQKEREENYCRSVQIISLLTKTELEILLMIRDGKNREEISKEKVIEEGTVKTHITNILKKLKYRKTADAIRELEKIGFFYYADEISK